MPAEQAIWAKARPRAVATCLARWVLPLPAVAAGLKDAGKIRGDKDLADLRGRADYQKLLGALSAGP
jgi:hypothetical protein